VLVIALALLAGGGSTRMGRDKALLPVAGVPSLVRLAGLGAELGLPVLICGRDRPADWSGPAATFLPDAVAGEGPLRGLEAALARYDEVLLLACDLPLVRAADLAWLLAAASGPLGTACTRGGQIEPLFSRYRAACRSRLAAELAAGRRSPQRLIAGGGFALVAAPPDLAAHLDDADTPAAWQSLTQPGRNP
jgi:molybdopterin-guanine dinucleotide biosynthesis protein A